jgi:hypothetical protein
MAKAVAGLTPLERAINRAWELGVTPTRVAPNLWDVPSSNGADRYSVRVIGPSQYTCTCPAGERSWCWHRAAVLCELHRPGAITARPAPAPAYHYNRIGRKALFD